MQFTTVATSLLATVSFALAQNVTGVASPTGTGSTIPYNNSTSNGTSPSALPTSSTTASNGAAGLVGSSALSLIVAGAAAFVL